MTTAELEAVVLRLERELGYSRRRISLLEAGYIPSDNLYLGSGLGMRPIRLIFLVSGEADLAAGESVTLPYLELDPRGTVAPAVRYYYGGSTSPASAHAYTLPLFGPVGAPVVPSTSWLGVSQSAVLWTGAQRSIVLTFRWSAAPSAAAVAQWRLRGTVTGITFLTGTRSGTFTNTVETITDAAANLPLSVADVTVSEPVRLEVSFDAVDATGTITLTSAATWVVS